MDAKNMRHAVILAGGTGTRLWPASRRACPKQFRRVTKDGDTLIEEAVARARAIAGERVMIVTAYDQVDITRHLVPSVEIIREPAARNTAAAIGLAAKVISDRDPDASFVVLPADHYVRDREGMTIAIDRALATAELLGAITLVGIKPTRPETGYGYLELPPPMDILGVEGAMNSWRVTRFIEKPCLADAEHYARDARYLWNAGIFCLTARRAFAEFYRHLPQVMAVLDGCATYEDLPSISFDKGVLEKTDRIYAVPADVGWNDVGSWAAIAEVRDRDERGNVVDEGAIAIDCEDSIVLSNSGLVAAVGVKGIAIVRYGDAVLVVPKDQAQRVREIVEALGTRGLEHYL